MRKRIIGLATAGLVLFFGRVTAAIEVPRDETTAPPVLELQKMKVSADVPLVKTADYHLLTPRAAAAAVAYDHSIYVIGGLGPNEELLRSIERFDTRTGKIERFGELQVARMWRRAVVIGRFAYILGGQEFTTGSLADGLEKEPSVPQRHRTDESAERQADYRMRMTEAMAESHGVRPGSEAEHGVLKFVETIEVLDLESGKISTGGVMPDPRAEFGCVALGKEVFIIGGKLLKDRKLAFTNRTTIWDSVSHQFQDTAALPVPAVCDATLVEGPFIVVAGGYTGTRKLSTILAFNPLTQVWNSVPPLLRPTSAQSTVFLDKFLFLFGDYDFPEEILAYNLQKKSSSIFNLHYTPSRHANAVCCDGKIFVIGGKLGRSSEPINTIQQFELTKNAAVIRR